MAPSKRVAGFFAFIRRLLCFRDNVNTPSKSNNHKVSPLPIVSQTSSVSLNSFSTSLDRFLVKQMEVKESSVIKANNDAINLTVPVSPCSISSGSDNTKEKLMIDVTKDKQNCFKEEDLSSKAIYHAPENITWLEIGETLDFMFLIIFTSFTTIATVSLFLFMSVEGFKDNPYQNSNSTACIDSRYQAE